MDEEEEQDPVRESGPTADGVEVARGTIVYVLCSELALLGRRSRFTASEIDPRRVAVVRDRVIDVSDAGELVVNTYDHSGVYSTFDAARDEQIRRSQHALDEAKRRHEDATEDLARAYSIELLEDAVEEDAPLILTDEPRDTP